MPAPDLSEFDLTVRQVLTRDTETDEECKMWRVESENLRRPPTGETPQEALEGFTNRLTSDNEDVKVDVEDLQVDDSSELVGAE